MAHEIIKSIGNAVRIRQNYGVFLVEFAALDGATGAPCDDTWGVAEYGSGRESIFACQALADGYIALVRAEGECHTDLICDFLDAVKAGVE